MERVSVRLILRERVPLLSFWLGPAAGELILASEVPRLREGVPGRATGVVGGVEITSLGSQTTL